MKVRAKVVCFVGGSRRRAGDVFEFAGDTLPGYLEVVAVAKKEEAPKPAPKRGAKQEEALFSPSEQDVI